MEETKHESISIEEDEIDSLTKTKMSPAVRHALTSQLFSTTIGGEKNQDTASTSIDFQRRINLVKNDDMTDMEAILVAQTITLDSIFHEMAFRSSLHFKKYLPEAEIYMKMALRAQIETRNTIKVLNGIKNPKIITISKQTNIADKQIVNNGQPMNSNIEQSKKKTNESNELLEEVEHERVDTRKAQTTSKVDTKMETMETLNRSKNQTGES